MSTDSTPDDTFHRGQVVTVFRNRLVAGGPIDEYERTAAEMEAAARQMPGFVDFKTFAAADGERVSLVTFEDAASQDAWRVDGDHRQAQQAGRDRFYASYRIQVCECLRVREFEADPT